MKIAFLDRDGTIIEDYEDELWRNVVDPVFIDESIDTLKIIKEKGYEIIIITNQYLIDEKIITLSQYKNFTQKFINKLKDNGVEILNIFYCPHSREKDCSCMKPKDGLIKSALEKYPTIDLQNSFIAGDSLCDIELGRNLGIKTFGIGLESSEGVLSINSLKNIVKYL
ncbi:HAD-IIIA family hydrolase [Tissierella sp. MSJ-40]|uniref:D,D-heptose 1,7-bisphosphate phosphatase n=1 Tax=Tissierella simiarum TaxID=2841534 RepID=A0ABS6E830_9FIRM|nr:HAD-IIIA family hydrolase [Tissierella simiarum]MBU5438711.1 HAD-IIIA family hydrolase [Tissierella simiarum]